uniref:Uncharacterized protein n=1 Tax=Solanum tuberosum TaxID=4113 RepID=M1BRR0_SOLTU
MNWTFQDRSTPSHSSWHAFYAKELLDQMDLHRDFQLHGTRLVVLDFTKPIKMKGSRTSAFCFAAYDIMVLW